MKVLDAPSQIINVRKTTSQCQTNTKYAKQNTKYAKQNTNLNQKSTTKKQILIYSVLSRGNFLSFWHFSGLLDHLLPVTPVDGSKFHISHLYQQYCWQFSQLQQPTHYLEMGPSSSKQVTSCHRRVSVAEKTWKEKLDKLPSMHQQFSKPLNTVKTHLI